MASSPIPSLVATQLSAEASPIFYQEMVLLMDHPNYDSFYPVPPSDIISPEELWVLLFPGHPYQEMFPEVMNDKFGGMAGFLDLYVKFVEESEAKMAQARQSLQRTWNSTIPGRGDPFGDVREVINARIEHEVNIAERNREWAFHFVQLVKIEHGFSERMRMDQTERGQMEQQARTQRLREVPHIQQRLIDLQLTNVEELIYHTRRMSAELNAAIRSIDGYSRLRINEVGFDVPAEPTQLDDTDELGELASPTSHFFDLGISLSDEYANENGVGRCTECSVPMELMILDFIDGILYEDDDSST